jgi:hypothetical protein
MPARLAQQDDENGVEAQAKTSLILVFFWPWHSCLFTEQKAAESGDDSALQSQDSRQGPEMKNRRFTYVLAGLTLLVFALSIPGALRDAMDRGGIYLFSQAFLEDIPKRLAGPGWFRFILQPVIAITLGIFNGMADARAGNPPYLWGIIFHKESRGELARTGFAVISNLLLMGILLDAVFQWIILGTSHAGAALVVGPVLIVTPYGVARALSNRIVRGIDRMKQGV